LEAFRDLDGELHSLGCAPTTGEKETVYALDRVVADSYRSRGRHIYGSAQPPYPELAGASFHARGNRRLGLAPWLSGIGQSLAGLGLGALLLGVLCWLGGMGMGDLKLCAAIGAWIGPMQLLFALVITSMAGGIMALCWAAAGGFLGELFQVRAISSSVFPSADCVLIRAGSSNPTSRKMPYAPAIAIGTIVSFFQTEV